MARRPSLCGPDSIRALGAAALAAAALLGLCACTERGPARRALSPAERLYIEGKYAEALAELRKTLEAGGRNGTLLYMVGFCRERVEGDAAARRATWAEAEPLLEAEIRAEGGATLDRLYYLTVINADQGESERMTQYARQAVAQHEKGPDPNALTGEDWFRLGRIHDFLGETSESEASYRRAVSAFGKDPEANPTYHALSLVKVADADFKAGRHAPAAEGYGGALKLLPGTDQVTPFRHALALLAAGHYDEAAARFAEDRDAATASESQYGADLARKAKQAGPLDGKDVDGSAAAQMPDDILLVRLKEAAARFRAARQKHSLRPGDPLPAEVVLHQKRFVTLLAEQMVRKERIQELCLTEGMADLVRR
jgi:tetratricopeptide (TPR) repeat protein